MLLELFPFVILYNIMALIYAYFFSDFLRFDMSLLLLAVTLQGVYNKHCLLSLFSFRDIYLFMYKLYEFANHKFICMLRIIKI